MMQVLSFSPCDDTGGLGHKLATSFAKHRPDWTYRAVVGDPSYLRFPIVTPWRWDDIARWWRESDAIHLHDGWHQTPPNRPGVVITYHGTGFRENPSWYLAEQARRGAIGTVSTLDLWLMAPDDVTWMPSPTDIDWFAGHRVAHDGPLRIGHAPTHRDIKHTAELIEAVEKMQADGADVELVLIEWTPWLDCLTIKGTCDVWFDQCRFGYGGNAIEAWAMSLPVVCGAPEATLAEYQRRFGRLPFLLADGTTDSIRDALTALLDPTTRQHWATVGHEHVRRWHDDRVVVDLLEPLYMAAAGC